MTRRMVIVLTGAAGSGKSTAAQFFASQHQFTRLRFAGPLKAMMHCLGLDERHTDGELKEVPCDILGGKTPRHAMQTIGTEWGRDLIDADLWVRAGLAQMDKLDNEVNVLFDDCRFPNELAALRARTDLAVIAIKIIRSPEVWSGTPMPEPVAAPIKPRRWWQFWLEPTPFPEPKSAPVKHVSETMDIAADYEVLNDGTVEQLHANLQAIIDIESSTRYPQLIPAAVRIERIAKSIFQSWPYTGPVGTEKPEWVDGGNSRMQDHARKQAEWIVQQA